MRLGAVAWSLACQFWLRCSEPSSTTAGFFRGFQEQVIILHVLVEVRTIALFSTQAYLLHKELSDALVGRTNHKKKSFMIDEMCLSLMGNGDNLCVNIIHPYLAI